MNQKFVSLILFLALLGSWVFFACRRIHNVTVAQRTEADMSEITACHEEIDRLIGLIWEADRKANLRELKNGGLKK